MANVLETVSKKLGSGEGVLHQYRTIYDGHDGFLVLSNQRIRFLEQKGVFRPSYQVTMDIPFYKVADVYTCTSRQLALKTINNACARIHYFVSVGNISANIIVDEIKDIKQQLTQH